MNGWFAPLGIVNLGLFMSAVLVLNLTPGPDTAYIVTRSVAQGPRAGVLSAIGIALGSCVHSLLCAFGLSALLASSGNAFNLIKIAGALYLIFIGLRMGWLARHQKEARTGAARPDGARALATRRRTAAEIVAQGFLTNVFNPKVLLFFVAFFPQFVTRDAPSKALALLVLGVVLIVNSIVYNSIVACCAGRITSRLRGMPAASLWLERGVAVAFVAIGARIVLIEQPH